MQTFQKPNWLDTAIGIAGFVLSALSALALLTDRSYFSNELAIIGALCLGLIVVVVAILFRPRHSFAQLKGGGLQALLDRLTDRANEVIIVNPAKSNDRVGRILKDAIERGKPVSIVGDAALLNSLIDYISDVNDGPYFETMRVSGASSEECMICYVLNDRKTLTVVFFADQKAYRFSLTDKSIVELIASILKRESGDINGFIGLGKVANPRKIISVAYEEQKRYLRNFQSLQKGFIQFYGTEVQSVQAGWVESGDFSSIDTLDMTTNPGRLLERQRYNAANRQFIESGGTIRRVYMVRKSDLNRKRFKQDLVELYQQQSEMGVQLGLVILDDLRQDYRKDFILYDDAIVLVEDQQASADYTLGRSTAYFGQEEIQQHRADFEAVWTGKVTGIRPDLFIVDQLGSPGATDP